MLARLWKDNKPDVIAVGLIVLVTAILLGLMLNRFLTVVNHDAAIFCILAQSLLKGNYLLVSEPTPQPYFTFPPFMAVQLAGLMLLFHNTDTSAMQPVFKGYISLLFLISLPVFYAWIRQMMGRLDAIVLTTLVALDPIVFKYSSDVLSDTPFWALSIGAVYAAWQLQKAEETGGKPWRWYGLMMLLIILSALTRQIGLALVLACLVTLALKKQWKRVLLSVLLFAFTVGAWQSYEHFYRSTHRSDIDSLNQQGVQQVLDKSPIKLEYVKHFLVDRPVAQDNERLQTSPTVLAENAWNRFIAYTEISIDQLFPEVKVKMSGQKTNMAHNPLFMVLVWIFFFWGLSRLFGAFPFGALYVGIYMGVLLVYPYISPRFVLPTWPLILVCIWWGFRAFLAWLQERKPALQKAVPAAMAVFIILALIAQLPDTIRWVNAGYKLKKANQGPSLREGNRAYYETVLWLRDHTPENSLIISRKPPVTYFYSGRKSTAFLFTAHEDKMFGYFEEKKKRYGQQFANIYIFEDHVFGDTERYLKPAVEKYRDRLSLVYTEPKTGSRVWLMR